jgi:hypothetical protein
MRHFLSLERADRSRTHFVLGIGSTHQYNCCSLNLNSLVLWIRDTNAMVCIDIQCD